MFQRKIITTFITYWALLIIAIFSGCQKAYKYDLIIKNVNIIDVKTGAISTSMDIVIKEDSIARIIKHRNQSYNALEVIDGMNQYLIPGLWDMHTHTWWGYKDFFPLLIANGITGIREMWGNVSEVKRIRREIRSGVVDGPEIISAGSIIDGKPAFWQGSDEADTLKKAGHLYVNKKKKGQILSKCILCWRKTSIWLSRMNVKSQESLLADTYQGKLL